MFVAFLLIPQNKIDLSLLVQTKSLGKMDYDTRLPHVELAKKLRKRGEGLHLLYREKIKRERLRERKEDGEGRGRSITGKKKKNTE